MKDARMFREAIPMLVKLIRNLREIHGSENNERILAAYDSLFQMYHVTGLGTEALLVSQKKISIYKALNGNDAKDGKFFIYLYEMGIINQALNKYDDAITNFKEAEAIVKKLPKDEQTKAWEDQIKILIDRVNKEKGVVDKVQTKPLIQRILPDTPAKMVVWATLFAGIAGFAAYTILKKKQ